ncbi:hypothetical protein [Terrimonas alba]|uniref:hypothetical protein n=1 Tax=Terrimonas alba TaxID=3349636 RepID=UPI0035F45C4C
MADTTSLKNNKRKAWKGMAPAIVQSTGKKGNITLTASNSGLKDGFLSLKAGN